MTKIKNSIPAILLGIIFNIQFSFAQANQLCFTIGNNGQLSNDISNFYVAPWSGSNYSNVNASNLHLSINYEYLTKGDLIFGAKLGYAAQNQESKSTIAENLSSSTNQKFYNFSVFTKYVWTEKKLQLSTGIEIPYFLIDKFNSTFHNEGEGQTIEQNSTIKGGNAFGINSVSSLKVFISKKIFISSGISFGFLVFNLGGKNQSSNFISNSTGTSIEEIQFETTYHKTTFTAPELNFGIGFKL